MQLSNIADYVNEKISSTQIALADYITTDCILANKQGRIYASNLPPQRCSLTKFKKGDVLVANIRPYLKKIWLADRDGGASNDVLVFRAKENYSCEFVYAVLLQDIFYDWVMKAPKGTRMPRGDKNHIMRFHVEEIEDSKQIGKLFSSIDQKITYNRQIIANLSDLAQLLYDYWFVQFDFPDENGQPYKSSGGSMLYDEKLKRDIPEGWHCGNLYEIASFTNGIACQKFRPKNNESRLPVIKIKEMHEGLTKDTEFVSSNIPDNVKIYNGDVLFSWSASLEVMLWCYGNGGLNQHIFKVTSANGCPKSLYYFKLLDYVKVFKKMAEARKTTMGHITQDHLEQSIIAIPEDLKIVNKFEKEIAPIFELIVTKQTEISSLIQQRNELLPIIMNGQITIE